MTGNTSKDQCLTPWSSISGKAEIIEVNRQYKSCIMQTNNSHFVKYNNLKTAIYNNLFIYNYYNLLNHLSSLCPLKSYGEERAVD